MPELSGDLIVRGENVQTLYNRYVGDEFEVNRRYQRKLVWSTPEKARFIDSLLKQLPVPLILTAERKTNGHSGLEIIDGLQRLNSIFAFIENDYPLGEHYFDLETLAETKLRKDNEKLTQKYPTLAREECVRIANYVLPVSTYRAPDEGLIEEVFRRINSNGRYLSRQEIRQVGAISNFADLVREVSCFVRGDESVRSLIPLANMPAISISTDRDGQGIYIDDVFWIRHKIPERDQVRESRDEEIVADLLASMVLDSMPRYASETLDEYYGLREKDSRESRKDRIELALQREDPEAIKDRFAYVHGEIEAVLDAAGKNFSQLVFRSPRQRVPRYYSTIFLAMYDLLIRKNRIISDYTRFAKALEGIADRTMNIAAGGGTWSAENKRDNIDAVAGIVRRHTSPNRAPRDASLEANEAKIARLLNAAAAEHSLFELKKGIHRLDATEKLDNEALERIFKIVTAIANDSPDTTGYILLGVADTHRAAERIKELHGTEYIKYGNYYVTGVEHEFRHHGGDIDGYQSFFLNKCKASDLDIDLRSQLLRDLRPVKFHGHTIILMTVRSLTHPVSYKEKWYERQGSDLTDVPAREVSRLFARFS